MNLESLVLPNGAVLLKDMDDDRSKATALDLGLYPFILAALKSTTGPCGAAAIQRKGDWLVAVLAWERCNSGNGWATLSMSPVNEETAGFLTRLSRVLVDGPENPESLN